MIKKYNQFNEGIRHLLVGPSEEEMIEQYKGSPIKLWEYSYKNDLTNGMIYAVDKGVDVNIWQTKNLIKPENKELIKTIIERGNKICTEHIQMLLNQGIFKLPYLVKYVPDIVLQYASEINNKDILIYAIQHGADVTVNSNTTLERAVKRRQFPIIKLLIQYGADVKSWKFTLIRDIMMYSPLDLIEYILDKVTFSYEQYNEIIRFSRVNPEFEKIVELINNAITKNVDYDVSKPWKPYRSVYGEQHDSIYVRQWYKDHPELDESIKHLLVGPTKEEVGKLLKDKFLSNEIGIDEYIERCKEYGLDEPSKEEKQDYYKREYKRGFISYKELTDEFNVYNWKITDDDFLELSKNILPVNLFDRSLKNGISIGMEYAIKKDPDVLKRFNLNQSNDHFLRRFVESSNYGCVEFLLKHGANVNVLNDICLEISCMSRDIKMVEILLKYGANINDKLLIVLNDRIKHSTNEKYEKIYIDILEILKKYMKK